jgi:Ca2+-binding RTX toxin-like protein
VRVNNSASPVNVITNTITNNTTAGVTISNVPVLNYTDNVLTGNAAGGSFTNITKVNYTASASTNDSFTVTPTVMSDNGNQTITYTLVPTLNVRTLGGDDTILAGPASGLTVWADAGTGTNDLVSWEGAGGNDDVQFSTAPTVGPDISATESVYRTGNTARLNIANAETRRIRTFGGDDATNYVRFGGSVATGFVIASGDNNDNGLGGLGNDTILGGDGDDRIDAANGNDSVLGEAGNDTMFGGVGNDFMDVGSGENQAFGQNGNDTIWAQNGNVDFVDGGAGFDQGKVDGIDLTSSLESLV